MGLSVSGRNAGLLLSRLVVCLCWLFSLSRVQAVIDSEPWHVPGKVNGLLLADSYGKGLPLSLANRGGSVLKHAQCRDG